MNKLIAEGKEKSLSTFLSKMFVIYREMAIYDWRYPGEYYSGVTRNAFVSTEVLDSIISAIPQDQVCEAAIRAGEAFRASLRESGRIDTSDWNALFDYLQILGFGELLHESDHINVRNPLVQKGEFLQAFLEGLLGCNLEIVRNSPSLVLR